MGRTGMELICNRAITDLIELGVMVNQCRSRGGGGGGGGAGGAGGGGPWRLGLRPKHRGGFAARSLLGAPPPDPGGFAARAKLGAPPQAPS